MYAGAGAGFRYELEAASYNMAPLRQKQSASLLVGDVSTEVMTSAPAAATSTSRPLGTAAQAHTPVLSLDDPAESASTEC